MKASSAPLGTKAGETPQPLLALDVTDEASVEACMVGASENIAHHVIDARLNLVSQVAWHSTTRRAISYPPGPETSTIVFESLVR